MVLFWHSEGQPAEQNGGYDAKSAILVEGGMMNSTANLLRLKRFKVETIKQRIAALDEMRTDLERKLSDLDDNVAREKQRARDSEIGRLAFPAVLRAIEVRRDNLHATLKEIEREYALVQLEFTNAFQDFNGLILAVEKNFKHAADTRALRA
jgi:flagellar FliJ protein